ncbi:cytochrome c6, chloroplastic [Benincasa hispida]|uniref:cytochrome c6, chloroplastic n=1 Tax=Benincasa hispida TaxID=102211 RepID=UPI00190260F6|nr:cytochrome c6, chloroplastic [Benincasa hispida]
MHLLSATSNFCPTPHCFPLKEKRRTVVCQIRTQVKILNSLAPPLIAVFLALSPLNQTPGCLALAQTAEIERGGALFNQACIGCHDGGGNIIQPGATLFSSDLERNGADAEEEIYRITYYGKGRMPGFGENCKPRGQCTFGPRLQEEEIRLLAKFVKVQADRGWPNP